MWGKYAQQMRNFQNLVNGAGYLTELQTPAGGSQRAVCTNQSAQTRTVDVIHVRQIQDDLLPELGVFIHFGLESVHLGTGDNPAVAPNHQHIFHKLALQG
jgi:hypothetical protein